MSYLTIMKDFIMVIRQYYHSLNLLAFIMNFILENLTL